jgi:hypothetical protein
MNIVSMPLEMHFILHGYLTQLTLDSNIGIYLLQVLASEVLTQIAGCIEGIHA